MIGTQADFKEEIQRVDALAEVNFEIETPFAIRIRPSHPRYFDALCKRANEVRCMGVAVTVMKEVDHFLTYEPEPLCERIPTKPKKLRWFKRLLKWLI